VDTAAAAFGRIRLGASALAGSDPGWRFEKRVKMPMASEMAAVKPKTRASMLMPAVRGSQFGSGRFRMANRVGRHVRLYYRKSHYFTHE
jgi:hypothetical protein